MGRVYEATDTELGRTVAVKVLTPEATSNRARLRLVREAQALARLSHPNVVQVFDAGFDGQQLFIAMELVRGRTLEAWLADENPDWRATLESLLAAGRGLQAAHDAGLVHRDFKPSNVLVGDDGRVRVADFGLVTSLDATDEVPGTSDATLGPDITHAGAVMGTPRTMAPEQHAGEQAHPATDQFSFCLTTFEALYGLHPFGFGDNTDWRTDMRAGRVHAPPNIAGPKPVWRALVRGLRPDSDARHADMGALLRALERGAQQPTRRRRIALAVAGLVVAAVPSVVWLTGSPAVEPCTGGASLRAEVWSPARADELASALGEAAPPIREALDRYARRWETAHRATCERARDGLVSSATQDATNDCLSRRLEGLDATLNVLTRNAETTMALEAVGRLLPPSRCDDEGRQARSVDPPTTPADAATAQKLRRALTRIEATHAAGELDLAIDELGLAQAEVDQLDHPPLTAEAALVTARLAMDRLEWHIAGPALDRSVARGLASGADLVAAEAAARRIFVRAMTRGDDLGVELANALVERVDRPAWLTALVENNVGVAYAMAGDVKAADRAFASAVDIAADADDVLPVDRSGYLVNVALRTPDPRRRDAAFEQALALATDSLGVSHPRTIEISLLRAQSTVDAATAIGRLSAVCDALSRRLPADWSRCHLCGWQLAEASDLAGNEGAARDAIRGADACLRGASRETRVEDPQWGHQASLTAAYDAILDGKPARALELLGPPRTTLESMPAAPWREYELVAIDLLEARAQRALDPDADIDPLLDHSREALRERIEMSFDQTPVRRQRWVDILGATLDD